MKFICEVCRIEFERPPSDKPKRCSRKCYDISREAHASCLQCGKQFKYFRSRKRKFCSGVCLRTWHKGSNHWHWKGGRIKDADGYISIYAPDHPKAINRRISEHRLVMEQVLGRILNTDEIVHHINGITDDNRPENLQIMSRKDHKNLHHSRHGKWTLLFERCIDCGTTERDHSSSGRCWKCDKRYKRCL